MIRALAQWAAKKNYLFNQEYQAAIADLHDTHTNEGQRLVPPRLACAGDGIGSANRGVKFQSTCRLVDTDHKHTCDALRQC